MAQLVECPSSTQDVAGSNPTRGSSFFLLRKKELSSGVVVYLALSLRMSLHAYLTVILYVYMCVQTKSHETLKTYLRMIN